MLGLDLPPDEEHPDPKGYQAERQALQHAWRDRVRQHSEHLFHAVDSDDALALRIEQLRDEFAELRRAMQRWRTRLAWTTGISALLIVIILGIPRPSVLIPLQ